MSHPTVGPQRPSGRKLAQAADAGRLPKRSATKGRGRARSHSPAGPPRGAKRYGPGGRDGKAHRFWNYPRAGKGPVRRWLPSWRFLLGSFLLLVSCGVGAFAWAYSTVEVPEPSQFAQAQTTTVYYSDGTTVMGEFAEVDRTIIDTTKLPKYVGDAVVASEDRTFYTNRGVDPKGIVRALINNLRGGSRQGASTLTQQYIKNYYVDTTDSYSGKLRQAIMAIKIDRSKTKSEILGSYLNTVYFGRGTYGIEAAAGAYFGVSAAELTPSQAALLAGIMPAPSAWDPAVDPQMAEQRWARVLKFMVEDGYLSQADYDAAVMPQTIAPKSDEVYAGTNGYLLQLVREEVVDKTGITPERIDTGGYKIVTTINKKDQDAAVSAVESLPEGADPNLRAALVSIDTATGGVIALYGGHDYLTQQVNAATDAVAQAGSTYKPFALVAALENGLTLANGYSCESPITLNGTRFENYRNVSYGWCDLVKSTANSVNTSYLRLSQDLGAEKANEVAVRAGLPQDTVGMDTVVQSVLGSASPHTIDIATAYATFASGGHRHDTHVVATVSNSGDEVVHTADTTGEKVFEDGVVADATFAMQQVVEYGSGTTALELGRPVAGKTGSSSDNKSAQFVGFTPQIATAVTLFQPGPDGSEQTITPWGDYEEITGSTYPADIFTRYMRVALQDLPVQEFPGRTKGSWKPGRLEGATAPPAVSPQPPAPVQPVEPATEPAEEQTEAPAPKPTQDPGQLAPVEPETSVPIVPGGPGPGDAEHPDDGHQDPGDDHGHDPGQAPGGNKPGQQGRHGKQDKQG